MMNQDLPDKTVQLPADARSVPTGSNNRQAESEQIVSLLHDYFSRPDEGVRNKLFETLRKRLETVARKSGMKEDMWSDREDVIQDALLKFAQQERKGSGIFNKTAAGHLCAKKISADIKGSIRQRRADLYRSNAKRRKIVERSLDDTAPEQAHCHSQDTSEYYAARCQVAESELRKQVLEVVLLFLRSDPASLTEDAVESAMASGGFNTAELSRKHRRSQATVWRELKQIKQKLRSLLEKDGLIG